MISIITPTYNRAYILVDLYISLKIQTSTNFEWIIIDDGSTDQTMEIVRKWTLEKNNFKISYFYKENGGKHRAINLGVKKSKGEYIFIVDSDDFLVKSAIEKIEIWIRNLPDSEIYAGVAGLKANKKQEIVGQYPSYIADESYIEATNLQRKKFKLQGDKAEILKREIMLKYPFPEFDGEYFIGEESAWNKIASDNYKIRWFNSIIYICEYLEDGLTFNIYEKLNKNSKGAIYVINQHIEYMPYLFKLSAISTFFKLDYSKKLTYSQILLELKTNKLNLVLGKILYSIRLLLKK